jgi:hypothetical protein
MASTGRDRLHDDSNQVAGHEYLMHKKLFHEHPLWKTRAQSLKLEAQREPWRINQDMLPRSYLEPILRLRNLQLQRRRCW